MSEAKLSGNAAGVAVGIDPGLANCALIALGLDGATVYSVLLRSKGKGVQRLDELTEGIVGFFAALAALDRRVDHICLEGYSMMERYGREQMGEAGATIKLALYYWFKGHPEFGLDERTGYPTVVSSSGMKKFVGIGGNAKKDRMPLGVYKKWGVEFRSRDEVDAYALSRIAVALANPEPTLLQYEREVLDHLTRHTEWPTQSPTPKPSRPAAETSPSKRVRKSKSSESAPPRTLKRLRRPSATPSTTPARSGSVRLVRERSTNR